MRVKAVLTTLLLAVACAAAPAQAQFDHTHAAWSALLKKHVVLVDGGKASQVNYTAFAQERAALKTYLDALSGVTAAEFGMWSKPQQMAFLINAYNAYTVEKVLTRYPNLKSIRDFGTVFGNPWKDKFFSLLGQPATLDQIEHERLRKPGAYDEPRVHHAVNCASIGCPMLREEAYVAARLDAQLEEQTRRFLSDRTRNRYNPDTGRLEVSKIYDWFREDWQSGARGLDGKTAPIASREAWLTRYADLLADSPDARRRVADGKAPLAFLEYDWSLNDVRR